MADFLNVDEVTEETKVIVSGFIRNCQCLFESDNPYYNIPELVTRIIISYFADIEYFHSKSDRLSLDTTKRKVKKIKPRGYDPAYGHVVIDGNTDKSIHRWIFQLVKDDATDSHFGIDGSENKKFNCYIGEEKGQYGIGCGCWEYNRFNSKNADVDLYGVVPELYTGDTITMELNCMDKSLNYHANDDIENKFGFTNICLENMEYVMAVSLSYENDCVELIKYEQVKII